MEVVHEVCCGLDVHKKSVTACGLFFCLRQQSARPQVFCRCLSRGCG